MSIHVYVFESEYMYISALSSQQTRPDPSHAEYFRANARARILI